MTASAAIEDALVARLRELPRAELQSMYDAAAEAVACAAALADNGTNPVTEVLQGAVAVDEWAHFPASDVVDETTRSRFYYHAHAADEREAGEHGHFHTFAQPPAVAGAVTHLVGLSTDASGRLIRLFTTNRWVTGEAWFDAGTVIGLLDRFDVTREEPSPALNRWVSAVVHMFKPQIADLLRARDARVADYKAAHPESDVLEDRALRVTSEMPVDFLAQIRAIEAALAAG